MLFDCWRYASITSVAKKMKHATLPQTRENNKNQFLNLTSDMMIPNTPFIKLKHEQKKKY